MTGGKAYSVAEDPSMILRDEQYTDGVFKVGQDVPAGRIWIPR